MKSEIVLQYFHDFFQFSLICGFFFLQAEKEAAALEEILGDPETIAQLDWLWSNKISANVNNTRSTVVEISQQVDKGCVKEELKPIERYVELWSSSIWSRCLHISFQVRTR